MAVLPYLETHVVDHCNLNCRGCGHFSPLSPPAFADPARFDRDLRSVARVFENVERLHLLGGEPLLHPEVLRFARSAREVFPEAAVRLVTNGLLLKRMPASFWERLSALRVRVDITRYPVRLDLEPILETATRHGVETKVTEPRDRFFTLPLSPDGVSRPDEARDACRALFDCPNLRDGRIFPCPVVALSPIFAGRFGWDLPVTDADSLPLTDRLTAEEVLEFLAAPVPWCRHCDTAAVRWFDWGRSAHELAEWT